MERQLHFFNASSPCCGGITIGGCEVCAAVPAQWRLSVSGISNAGCSNCDRWNGDWILTNHTLIPLFGGACLWSSPVELGSPPCSTACGNCPRWTLILTALEAELDADSAAMGIWTLPIADFDCLGSNTLTLGRGAFNCAHWPGTLTITPV